MRSLVLAGASPTENTLARFRERHAVVKPLPARSRRRDEANTLAPLSERRAEVSALAAPAGATPR